MGTSQSDWLTQTKFMPPSLRDDIVPRRRLLDLLLTCIRTHPLTLVSAPAGYGKTTLLACLAAMLSDVRVAWVSLDEDDNDPTRFLAALVGAIQKSIPTFGVYLYPLLANVSDPAKDARRFISALINAALAELDETWIVLDDLHLLTEPSIFAALDYWLERMPPQMHLIVATRHDPPLVLARLRARGQLAEVRAPLLRFTVEEARDFMNGRQCLGLSNDELTLLDTRAEGWAAGLRLLAGSLDRMPSASDRGAFLQVLAHTDRHVFEFLAEEVLKHQEPATQVFLRETSVLPELTPALCAAVTAHADAQASLDDLARRNLFLTLVDEGGNAYRYHALFAEFLRTQLKRDAPARFAELHQRAGDAQRGTARAVAHYLAAESWADAAQTIESIGEDFKQRGMLKTLSGWIESLPTGIRDAHPRLLYWMGFCAVQRGALPEAMIFLESARHGFEATGEQACLADVLLLMIDTVSRQHDYARQAELAQQALAIPLPVHGQVQLLMAQVWQAVFQPDLAQADAALNQALELALTSNDVRAFNVIAPILNMHVAFLPGGTARLEHYCREVLAQYGREPSAIQAGTRSFYSYLLFLKGSLDQAAQEADQALRACAQIGGLAYTESQASTVHALLDGVRGDYVAQEKLWATGVPGNEQIPSLQPFVVLSLYFVGRAQWMQKKFEEARQTEAHMAAIHNPAEFPESTVGRKLMRALIEMTDRQYDNAELTLAQGLAIEIKWPHTVLIGSVRVMLAYLYLQRKHEKEAWAEFAPFLAECEQRHMAGLLLQETLLVVPLLRLAVEKKSHVEFAKHLLDILDKAGQDKPVLVPDTGETLSPREVEVLRLVAGGASNREIADKLIISEHTVKIHMTNILGKLRVSSRTQAAARAQDLRLLR